MGGNDPTSYSPIKFSTLEILHDQAWNPRYGNVIIEEDQMVLGLLRNNIIEIRKVGWNTTTPIEVFSVSYNELGNFSTAVSDTKTITANYRSCP